MRSLPWIVAAVAVLAAAVGTSKLRDTDADLPPDTPARLVAAAHAEVGKNRPLDALRKVKRVSPNDRVSSRALQVEGEALLALHFAGRAEQRWLEAIKLEPTLDEAPFHLFGQYFVSGRHAETRRLAVELAPKQLSPSFAAAMLLEAIRQEHERAAAPICLEIYEPVLLREPENGHAIRTVGRCFVELGRVTEGLALLKKATEKLPSDPETWALWFESLHDAGRSARVVGAYASAPESVKSHSRVLRVLAAALDAGGDANAAEERLQEAVKSNPFDRKACMQFASLLARRGDVANAKKLEERGKVFDDLREQQAALLQRARSQNNDPGADLLRKLASVCNDLGWTDVGGEFDRLAKRRAGRSSEGALAMTGPTVNFVVKFAALALVGVAGLIVWKSTRSLPMKTVTDRDPSTAAKKPRQQSPLKTPPIAASAYCPIHFVDGSKALGLSFEHQRGHNGEYWLPETMGGGAAWFDFDGDGWQDLYLVQGKRTSFGRDALFRNERGRKFVRMPEDAVPADPEFGQGVAAGDFNNDGFDDLYVTNFVRHRLYRNNGDGTLSNATASAGLGSGCELWGTSVAFGDLDGDGALDVVVCNYAKYLPLRCKDQVTGERRYCGPDAFTGRPVVFLHNLGDGRFRDESQSTGLGDPIGKCLGAVVARLADDSCCPQVFIANDLQPNFLFRKVPTPGGGLQFEEVAAALHVDRNGEGVRQANMGVAVGDYDRDGRLDLYSTHYYNEHDTLWRNLGPEGFRDVTKSARLFVPTLPQLSWGTQFFDADNDGWLDLFVTSGNINNDVKSATPYRMTPQLFWNRGAAGDLSFDDVSVDVGTFFRVGHVGRGSAVCDFDRDGRPDLVVVHHHENSALLKNLSPAAKSFGLEFIGVVSPRDGHGVRAVVSGPSVSKPLVREIHGGGSYLSADARSLLIGVGAADGPYTVEVQWPSGRKHRFLGIVAGSWITFLEGRDQPIIRQPFMARSDGDASPR